MLAQKPGPRKGLSPPVRGNPTTKYDQPSPEGLSPPVRGNQSKYSAATARYGSIPARAGEPGARREFRWLHRVYPRPCGGTTSARHSRPHRRGLSPPVRGNRHRATGRWPLSGSIPARAGEPPGPAPRRRGPGVYPRPCGGTLSSSIPAPSAPGLSPPVRGNRDSSLQLRGTAGSIPARAGEPTYFSEINSAWRVYPRPCGGTSNMGSPLYQTAGLSPPVRGNHVPMIPSHPRVGSIPARAGEPRATLKRNSNVRVYPRPCGGTDDIEISARPDEGLSPPVRGNRARHSRGTATCGSIPARAGEPTT